MNPTKNLWAKRNTPSMPPLPAKLIKRLAKQKVKSEN